MFYAGVQQAQLIYITEKNTNYYAIPSPLIVDGSQTLLSAGTMINLQLLLRIHCWKFIASLKLYVNECFLTK